MRKHKKTGQSADEGGIKARVVVALRAFRGSLKEFSKASGIPYPSLMDYVSGKKKPGLDALAAIVATSGVSPLWLLTGEGQKDQHTQPSGELYIDGRLLARIAEELELAWIRLREMGQEADVALLEALGSDAHEALVATELGSDKAADFERRMARTGYLAVLAATIYNSVRDLPAEPNRLKRIREEAYTLLTYYPGDPERSTKR